MATDVEIVERLLRGMKKGQRIGSEAELVERLSERWSPERASRAVRRALDADAVPLRRTRGGALVYEGVDHQMYENVRLRLPKWMAGEGWRVDDPAVDCSDMARKAGLGEWSVPDIWLRSRSTRRTGSAPGTDLHVIEVENAQGFGLQSIYQAFECGRGAQFAWVFGLVSSGNDMTGWRDAVRATKVDTLADLTSQARILRAAQEQNVGLVIMGSTTQPSKWLIAHRPRRRHVDPMSPDVRRIAGVVGLA